MKRTSKSKLRSQALSQITPEEWHSVAGNRAAMEVMVQQKEAEITARNASHPEYVFRILIHTNDCALLACFRALAFHCQRTGNKYASFGGVHDGLRQAAFRFTDPEYRDTFVDEANRLFPADLWHEVSRSDTKLAA